MPEDTTPLIELDADRLTPIVRRALEHPSALPASWQVAPIAYATFLPDRRLYRVDGDALAGSETVPWSAVLKVMNPGTAASTGSEREARAYEAGLLNHLPGGLRAPRLLGCERSPDRVVYLWLERVEDACGRAWPLEQYGVAAHHLGQFNGHYAGAARPPSHAWLSRRWAESHSSVLGPDARPMLEELLAHPVVRDQFSAAERHAMRRLVDDQPHLVETLRRFPNTLCHHDASSANLFARRRAHAVSAHPDAWETVAIDWEEIGPGPVGAEIATLVFGSIRRGDFPAERAGDLERSVLDGYVAGLRSAGWSGDPREVRLVYAASTALRSFHVLGTLRVLVDPHARTRAARTARVDQKSLPRQRTHLLRFLLTRADEARRLAREGIGP